MLQTKSKTNHLHIPDIPAVETYLYELPTLQLQSCRNFPWSSHLFLI